jgi:hypothetical protein
MQELEKEVTQSEVPVLVDFWTSVQAMPGPLAPGRAIARKVCRKIKVSKVDVKNRRLCLNLRVLGCTFLFIRTAKVTRLTEELKMVRSKRR